MICSDLLNDEKLKSKWDQVLNVEYSEVALLCYVKIAGDLNMVLLKYCRDIAMEEILACKIDICEVRVMEEVDSSLTLRMNDEYLNQLLVLIFMIFRQGYIRLYRLGTNILTKIYKIYKEVKNSHRFIVYNRFIIKELTSLTKVSYAPKLKKAIRSWVQENMPEN
jgi:hypothetical protein